MLSLGIRYEKYTQLLITTSSMHLSSRYRWVSRFKYCCIDSSRFFLVYPEVPRAIRSIVSFTILDQACCLHYSLVFIVSSKVVRATFYIKTTKKMLTKIKPMSIIVFVFCVLFFLYKGFVLCNFDRRAQSHGLLLRLVAIWFSQLFDH